ncbi:Shedu immune nuclease family protein [Phenylobacterium sp. J367]|uniref:Shedu immune nuclease family protein n=1 Tax=Phenylobacterium sp. J367 TaxID=2898435 RepID=UPI00215079C7|nr:Shedu immune nuclease family protein [Phenylobacterium sp. J367]MCR5881249.1 DUF4263 domain-containing protein [Phenylobacterium sp. J367]
MVQDVDERDIHYGRKEGWSYPSRAFGLPEQRMRIVTQAIDTDRGLRSAKIKDEVVLRVTPGERYEIKATLVETDRSVQVLTIQKYNARSGPSDKFHFSFLPHEVERLVEFLIGLQSINLESPEKARISPETLRRLISDRADALRVYEANPDVLSEIVQNKFTKHDLVAVGYRREQLNRFKRLLEDASFFAAEQQRLSLNPEALWQQFFTGNSWIFGYGLCYQFLTPLSDRDPEQVVLGASIAERGKRADALLKTRGQISSLCYVEIKRHDEPLLGREYRPGAWQPSSEISGGVAQAQATVMAAAQAFRQKFEPKDAEGNPTGEVLFNVEPKSFLVVGTLQQFRTPAGVNESKLRSFETFRRNTRHPEIITFDELYERARFIVGDDE